MGPIAVRSPKHARKELEAYLECGLLCRAHGGAGRRRYHVERRVAFI